MRHHRVSAALVGVFVLAACGGAESVSSAAATICDAVDEDTPPEAFGGRVSQAVESDGLDLDELLNAIDEQCGQVVSRLHNPEEEPVAQIEAPQEPSEPDEPDDVDEPEVDTSVEAAEPEGSELAPLPLGASAEIGPWTVTVSDVDLNADDAIIAANPYTDPLPPREGRYVLVWLEATYNGEGVSSASMDLRVAIAGSDNRHYIDYDCDANPPNGIWTEPDLSSGGTAAGSACVTMPPEAIDGASVSISRGRDRVFWQVD